MSIKRFSLRTSLLLLAGVLVIPVAATLAARSLADEVSTGQTCCAKRAYCCQVKQPCCDKAMTPEFAASVVDASGNTCCAKHAYCCKVKAPCCGKHVEAESVH